jgi:hypothetical protein
MSTAEYRKKLNELNALKRDVSSLENEVKRLFRKSIESDVSEKFIEQINSLKTYPGGLNKVAIRDFLCRDVDAKSIGLYQNPVGIEGEGPWEILEEEGLQQFLESKGFDVVEITNSNTRHIILGFDSNTIDYDDVDEQIQRSIDEDFELRIYTQELFIIWLITGDDPLDSWDEDDLLALVADHEPMQHVLGHEIFTWPEVSSSDARSDDYVVKTFEWSGSLAEESPLAKMGYTVRADAISQFKRREILRSAYLSTQMDRYLLSDSDQKRWGKANTAQRLYSISHLISWLAGFQGSTKPEAKHKWEDDLQWLKKEFYLANKRMNFSWPKTSLSSSGIPKKPTSQSELTALNPAAAWPFPTGSRP